MVASDGCSSFRGGFLYQKPLSPKPGVLSHPFSTPTQTSFEWIGAEADATLQFSASGPHFVYLLNSISDNAIQSSFGGYQHDHNRCLWEAIRFTISVR